LTRIILGIILELFPRFIFLFSLQLISALDVKAAEDPPGSPWRTAMGLLEVFGR
jgi:hypothetical protein